MYIYVDNNQKFFLFIYTYILNAFQRSHENPVVRNNNFILCSASSSQKLITIFFLNYFKSKIQFDRNYYWQKGENIMSI